jgi:TnsA-like endonuclease N terminal
MAPMTEDSVLRAGLADVAAKSDVSVRYRADDGRYVGTTLPRLPVAEVLSGRPVREFRSWQGRRHYSGWYWASTTGSHVVYESRLELARILLADQDPDVVGIAAQPFLLKGADGDQVRRHVPDLLLAYADGAVTVVDVKAASRVGDPKVVAQFAWTRAVCRRHGFGFEVWSGCDPVQLENVRFLAGYRRAMTVATELIDAVVDAAAEPTAITVLEQQMAAVAPPWVIRPVILHALWRSWLAADLSQALDGGTVVSAAEGRV